MAMQRMKLSQFRYELPEELIAQHPLDNRDDCRLMIVHRDTGKFEHRMFKDVVDIFDEGDVFVANNTKVYFGESLPKMFVDPSMLPSGRSVT